MTRIYLKTLRLALILALISICLNAGAASAPTLTVFAGDPTLPINRGSFSGDGGPALKAGLNWPCEIVIDPWGRLVIADSMNFRLRRVGYDGTIHTMAQGGKSLAVDIQGNIYTDPNNIRQVVRVSSDGRSTIIAGTGEPGYSGDGGAATAAQFNSIYDLVVDSHGNLYIADADNYRIRKVSPSGIISTFAGTGQWPDSIPSASGPATERKITPIAMAVDAADNLYVYSHFFVKITPDGTATTFVNGEGRINPLDGNGKPADQIDFTNLNDIEVDSSGNIFLMIGTGVFGKIDTKNIFTVWKARGDRWIGDFPPEGAPLDTWKSLQNTPGITLDRRGNLYFSSWENFIGRLEGVAAPGLLAGQPYPNVPLPGDLNRDGKLDVKDVFASLSLAMGNLKSDPASDVNGDGRYDLADTRRILQWVLLGPPTPL